VHSRTDPDELRDLHLRKLPAGLAEVLKTNAFWRSRLTEVGGRNDFERLPLTTKADLLADQADLRQALGVRLGYRVVEPGSLPRSELKSKRIVRRLE
jgi:hypothetical protein